MIFATELLGIPGTEWVAYLASAAVLSSFLMKDMRKLRLINMLGAVFFIIYGFLLTYSWPIIITNAAIFTVHVYHLWKDKNQN